MKNKRLKIFFVASVLIAVLSSSITTYSQNSLSDDMVEETKDNIFYVSYNVLGKDAELENGSLSMDLTEDFYEFLNSNPSLFGIQGWFTIGVSNPPTTPEAVTMVADYLTWNSNETISENENTIIVNTLNDIYGAKNCFLEKNIQWGNDTIDIMYRWNNVSDFKDVAYWVFDDYAMISWWWNDIDAGNTTESKICEFSGCKEPVIKDTSACEKHLCHYEDCHNPIYTEGVSLCDEHTAKLLDLIDSYEPQNQNTTVTLGEEQALKKAYAYLDYTAFSYSGLINQLKYEGFTTAEATYAVDNCGADWNEQAAIKAQQYLDYTSFSRSGLIDQLKYEGFTDSQAAYGVRSVGY